MREAKEMFGGPGATSYSMNEDKTQRLLICCLGHFDSPDKGDVKFLGFVLDSNLT